MKTIATVLMMMVFALAVNFSIAFAGADIAQEYVVRKGDTMWKIAEKMNVSSRELRKANMNIKNSDLIQIGQIIKVPMKKVATVAKELLLVKVEKVKTMQSTVLVVDSIGKNKQSIIEKLVSVVFSAKKIAYDFLYDEVNSICFLVFSILAVIAIGILLLNNFADQEDEARKKIKRSILVRSEPMNISDKNMENSPIFHEEHLFVGVCEHLGVRTFCLIDRSNPIHVFDVNILSEMIINKYGHNFSRIITFKLPNSTVINKMIGNVGTLTSKEQGKLVAKIVLSLSEKDLNFKKKSSQSQIAYG